MKNNLLSLLMAVLVAVSFTSCSDDTEKELSAEVGLVGTWTLQSADVMINDVSLDEFIKELAALLGVPESELSGEFDMTDGFTSGSSIEFRDNGTYVFTEAGDDTPESGRWTATEKTVTISDANGNDPMTLDVKSLTSSKAQFYMMEEESEDGMTMKVEITLNLTK